MWIRLLLLVIFAIGLNWVVSDHIKRQYKQQATEIEALEQANFFSKTHTAKSEKEIKKTFVHQQRVSRTKKI